MKTNFFVFFTSLILTCVIHAQSEKPVNSATIIEQGIQLNDKGQYKEAIRLFGQVPINDTNYARALYERAYSETLDSNNKAALSDVKQGLMQEDDSNEELLLILYGSITDDMGDSKRALEIYDSTLLKYPGANRVKLNKAITLLRMNKLDESEAVLQHLLVESPFYSNAHYWLGRVAIEKGEPVPAMMCFFTYLLNAPSGNHFQSTINYLSDISKMTDNIKELIDKRNKAGNSDFDLVEKIIRSKIALDEQYKLRTSLNDPIIRQLQVMMEKLTYDEHDNNFYIQFYTPFLIELFSQNKFEPAVYQAFSNVSNEQIQRYMKKNTSEVKSMLQLFANLLEPLRATRELNYIKRRNAQILWHFDDGDLFGNGKLSKDNLPIEKWTFYFNNGNVKSMGEYNTKGHKEGKWEYYYEDGKFAGEDNWKDGNENGEDITYNKYGNISIKAHYNAGKLEGEKITYFTIGHPSTIEHYKDGLKEGKIISYFSNGRVKIEAEMSKDVMNGLYKSFFEDGQPEVLAHYVNGEEEGSFISYYDNGQLETEKNFKKGKLDGIVKEYHPNGKLMTEYTIVDDNVEGDELRYNEAGVLIQRIPFKKGKVEGMAQYFADDGVLYSSLTFVKDRLWAAQYFDKAGKQISSSQRKGKSIELSVYNPLGFKESFCVYTDKGEKQDSMTYYFNSGNIKETDHYLENKLEGITTAYYENGKKQSEVMYHKDEKDGSYTDYYVNGKVKESGWYSNGEISANSMEFNERGNCINLTTYLNGEISGIRKNFTPSGKPDNEEIYRDGFFVGLNQYDSLGMRYNTCLLKNGSGKFISTYPGGQKRNEGEYFYGELNGPFTTFFFDGSKEEEKLFDHGIATGLNKQYYFGGQLSVEGQFKNGKKTGVWKVYSEDGKLNQTSNYDNGELSGTMTYFYSNGKTEREIEYKNNQRNGAYKRYSDDGELSTIFYYKNDEIYGYTYNDKNGHLIPLIQIRGGNGKVESYFSNGNKSAEMTLKDGKLFGPYILYFTNGKPYYTSTEECSSSNGMVTEYYNSGKVKSKTLFYYDNTDGPYKYYFEDGTLKEEGFNYNGYPNGEVTYYDKMGKPVQIRTYYYGLLTNVSRL